MSRQALPEGDAPIGPAGQDPGVWSSLSFGAHTHIGIQAEAQQEAAQQGGVVLTVPLTFEEIHIINIRIKFSSFFSP